MAYNSLKVIHREHAKEIKDFVKVYTNDGIATYKGDIEVKEIFKDYDYLIEIKDINAIIERSRLKEEIENIKGLKISFEQSNDSTLREQAMKENDELEETTDREILNRNLVNNLKRRGLKFTHQDSIYLKNNEDLSVNEVKAYYLNTSLTSNYNTKFDKITQALKKTITSSRQTFTIFKTLFTMKDYNNKYVVVIPEMTFNNRKFTKELYKLFAPYFTLAMCEVVQTTIQESQTWGQCDYYLPRLNNSKVVMLEDNVY